MNKWIKYEQFKNRLLKECQTQAEYEWRLKDYCERNGI